MTYRWKTQVFPVDAQSAGKELERITKKYDVLQPSLVVAESRDASAVLHPCFEWDDRRAAEQFRGHQAQKLIQNLVVVQMRPDIDPLLEQKPIRAFINLTETDQQQRGYLPVETVLLNTDYRRQMLEAARRDAAAFCEKYAMLAELSELVELLQRLLQQTPADQPS